MLMRKITVLAPSFVLTSILAIVPALASISHAFPHIGVSAIQMLITLPSLVAFPVIIFSGSLSSIFTKKKIALTALSLMLIGGLLPFFVHHSFSVLIVASVIFGLGLGGISPMTTALVNEHFSHDQAAMMGYQSAFFGAGGMLFSFVGGLLASHQWWYAYLSYLILIPVILLVLLLPKGVVVKSSIRFAGLFNGSMVYYLIQCIITSIGFNVFNTNIAMLIEEIGLGGASLSGKITSLYSAVSIVSGILTGRIIGRFQKYTLSFLFVTAGVGMLCIYLGKSLPLIVLGAFLIGFTFSVFMPAGYSKATQSAPASAATMAIAVYCCSHQLGQFLTPFAINRAASLLHNTVAVKFLLAFLILILMFAISAVREFRRSTKAAASA